MSASGHVRIAGFFVFFTLVSVAVTGFLAITGERMTARNAPLVDAAMEVKLNGALAHLWFEEVISGDRNENIRTVWSHLREADWFALAMLEGGQSAEGHYLAIRDTAMRRQVEELRERLRELEAIARQRFDNESQSLPGSEIDQRFDRVFAAFLEAADRIETALLSGMTADLRRFRITSAMLIGFMPLSGLFIGMAIFRLERQRNRHVATIASASAEIRRQNAELQGVVKNLPGAAYTYTMPAGNDVPGPRDRIVFVNKEACQKIWGIPAAEVEADSMAIARLVDDPAALEQIAGVIRRALLRLQPWYALWPIRTPAGQRRWLEGRGYPVRGEDGSTTWFSLVVDATDQVARDQELERERELSHRAQKQQSIGQLTGGVAHDFNNLLAVILGNLELLRDEESDPDRIGMIDAGIGATRRGAELTRNMLAFARKARLQPRPIDLNSLVREMCNWAGRTLPSRIEIAPSLSEGLWTVLSDPASTEAALLNLILNARDAMSGELSSGPARLSIETANATIERTGRDARNVELPPGRYVILSVTDTGHGIAAEKLSDIFEPFYTTKPPGAGSGLGLSMIQGFMQQSGGVVLVYSEPGEGTTFQLCFPALPPDGDEVARAARTSPP